MNNVNKELDQDEYQNKFDMTTEKMMRIMRKMLISEAPGPNSAQSYWLKTLTTLHEKLVLYLQECLDSVVVADSLTKGRTVLIQKDKTKGNIASTYRPIIFLPLVWKLLIAILTDEIYDYLQKKLFELS